MSSAANFPNLSNLSAKVLNYSASTGIVQDLVQAFLDAETEPTYTPMATAFAEALTVYAVDANDSLRLLLAISDGTVAYDSSKSNNTFANYETNSINSSNHNTRPEIMVAILGNTGVGVSNRYSKSVSAFLKYNALRFGDSTQNNAGSFRVSLTNA